ncbi:MAG: Proton/glutamate-aspartate symporter [Phycisphaerae bacterium]|nr:Proton/glutamate-aspartate symporter [Phycisphaerae bacterium]
MASRIPLHHRILLGLLAGLILGSVARSLWGDHAALSWTCEQIAYPLGQIFLRLIFMAVVPLVVAALALGVTELGDVHQFGRVGLKTLFMTLLFSSMAVVIGLLLVNWVQPGRGLPPEAQNQLLTALKGADTQVPIEQAAQAKTLTRTLLDFLPRNPLAEAVRALEGGLIPLMVFALIVGLAMSRVGRERAAPLHALLESLFAVMLKIIDFGMQLAPLGVAALIFNVTVTLGWETLQLLSRYVLVVLTGLTLHVLLVYSLALRTFAGRSPLKFFADIREVLLTAFSTSSSNATLPLALEVSAEKLHIDRATGNFVLTIGATANQNGTALFEGVTVLFLAQFFGIDLSWTQQVTVMAMSIVAGVGTAGVPGGSLPMVVVVLQSVGVPPEGIGIVLGVDRFLDMARTVVNVAGDLTIAACVDPARQRA